MPSSYDRGGRSGPGASFYGGCSASFAGHLSTVALYPPLYLLHVAYIIRAYLFLYTSVVDLKTALLIWPDWPYALISLSCLTDTINKHVYEIFISRTIFKFGPV
jgi:hypothetical protein